MNKAFPGQDSSDQQIKQRVESILRGLTPEDSHFLWAMNPTSLMSDEQMIQLSFQPIQFGHKKYASVIDFLTKTKCIKFVGGQIFVIAQLKDMIVELTEIDYSSRNYQQTVFDTLYRHLGSPFSFYLVAQLKGEVIRSDIITSLCHKFDDEGIFQQYKAEPGSATTEADFDSEGSELYMGIAVYLEHLSENSMIKDFASAVKLFNNLDSLRDVRELEESLSRTRTSLEQRISLQITLHPEFANFPNRTLINDLLGIAMSIDILDEDMKKKNSKYHKSVLKLLQDRLAAIRKTLPELAEDMTQEQAVLIEHIISVEIEQNHLEPLKERIHSSGNEG